MTRKFAIISSDGKIKLGAHNLTFHTGARLERAIISSRSNLLRIFKSRTSRNLHETDERLIPLRWILER